MQKYKRQSSLVFHQTTLPVHATRPVHYWTAKKLPHKAGWTWMCIGLHLFLQCVQLWLHTVSVVEQNCLCSQLKRYSIVCVQNSTKELTHSSHTFLTKLQSEDSGRFQRCKTIPCYLPTTHRAPCVKLLSRLWPGQETFEATIAKKCDESLTRECQATASKNWNTSPQCQCHPSCYNILSPSSTQWGTEKTSRHDNHVRGFVFAGCFGNSVTASTKSNSCLLVSLFYYCRCINVFRTMIHKAMNTWETITFIPHASQASQACQGRGEREKIFPNIYRSSQTLWCLVPGTPGVAPEQIGHCEHPQFLFRRQIVLSDHLTLSADTQK